MYNMATIREGRKRKCRILLVGFLAVAEATGDAAAAKEAKQKVKMEQARMRAFIDETGRARRYDRERIAS